MVEELESSCWAVRSSVPNLHIHSSAGSPQLPMQRFSGDSNTELVLGVEAGILSADDVELYSSA